MARRQQEDTPAPYVQEISSIIAMAVRNAMEEFHVKHLSDRQMVELNPIIRNAICTTLHASVTMWSPASQRFLAHNAQLVPSYWEAPQLTEGYLRLVELCRQDQQDGDTE